MVDSRKKRIAAKKAGDRVKAWRAANRERYNAYMRKLRAKRRAKEKAR